MTEITPVHCVRGCVEKGTGAPMPATHGSFCVRDHKAAIAALRLLPELMEHMVAMKPHPTATPEKVDVSRDAPVPGNVLALSDSHETYRRLVYWSALWSSRMGITAPGPAIGAWRDGRGRVVGLPANVSPKGAGFVSKMMTDWLELHLESILHLAVDDVDYFLGDLRDVFRLEARWPRSAKPYYSKLPCPDDRGRIAVHPPRWAGDEVVYQCETCGRLFTEDQHEFYARLFAHTSVESDAVKRHLMRKYGV